MTAKEIFLKKMQEKHGNSIDLSKIEYINSSTKVCLICHNKDKNGVEHGEYWQSPSNALRRCCPKCANEKRGPKKENRMTTEKFILKASETHSNKYDYSKTKYIDADTKICIICPEHGEFWQLPYAHLQGQGCPKCAGKCLNREDIISKFNEIHKNIYNYDKVVYKGVKTPVEIICNEHGSFWQKPEKHLMGQGCPLCGNFRKNEDRKLTFNEVAERASVIHSNKYRYIESEFNNIHDKIEIICPTHGSFRQNIYDHLNGHGCPKCGINSSKAEDEIISFLKDTLNINDIIQRERSIIAPQEIDIFLPQYNIGIEYNGCIWHSEKFKKDRNYHLDKLITCNEKHIKLIQIFEDEYINNKEIVLEKIRHLVKKDDDKERIYARKCEIKEINKHIASLFLNKNHIQRFARSTVYLGAYYEGIIVAVMSFKKEKDNKWELTRFATDITKHCIGIGGKAFSFFVNNYNPSEVKSFADRRWTLNEENNLYTRIGFTLEKTLKPDYSYVTKKGNREHKFNFRKQILIKKYGEEYNLTMNMTEREMTEKLGFYKIWNCGLYKYVWKNGDNV